MTETLQSRVGSSCLSKSNSTIFYVSGLVATRRCDTWFSCHIVRKVWTYASSLGSSLYLAYGYEIVSNSESFGTCRSRLLSSGCSISKLLPLVDTRSGTSIGLYGRDCSLSEDSVTLSSCSAHQNVI